MRPPKAPIAASLLAVASGLPLYLALERLELLPLTLRDRPWPLELVALLLALLAGALALRGAGRARRLPVLCSAVAFISVLAFMALVRGLYFRLPPPAPEMAIGQPAAFTLTTDTGASLDLSDLRGHTTLLVYVRSSW